jgi:predicted RNase H-like HicB family nuclease
MVIPMPNIEMEFKLPIKYVAKKKHVVASCPVLDVASQGETEQKARVNLIEALTLFLTTCIEMGTLDDVLKQCGFRPSASGTIEIPEKDYINIPIYLLTDQAGTKHCRA